MRAERPRARHSGDPFGRGDGRLRQRPDQPRFDLLRDEARIDDTPAIHRRDEPMDLYPLVAADAGVRDQTDVRSEGGAARNAHRTARPAAVPSGEPRRALKAAREAAVLPSMDMRKASGSMPCGMRQLVDEALGEKGELALRRAAHVAARKGKVRRTASIVTFGIE